MNPEENIFDLRLNEFGIAAVRKFGKIARWILLLVILQSIISIAQAIVSIIILGSFHFTSKSILLQTKIYPYYTLFFCILAGFQVYYYWRTSKNLLSGIDENDEIRFNQAFTDLYRNAIFAMFTLLLGFIMNLWEFIAILNSYNKLW